MAVKSLVDVFIVYRIIRILTTSWKKQKAFKLGIIDKDGKVLRPAKTLKTREERSSYTLLHRFIFNIKRLLEKLPFGRTKLASYIGALAILLKEEYHEDFSLNESYEENDLNLYVSEAKLAKGIYRLKEPVLVGASIEKKIAKKGDLVLAKKDLRPVNKIVGDEVFQLLHIKTKEELLVRADDLGKTN